DGDANDRLIYAYDAGTDAVTQLTGASAYVADRVALSAQVLAMSIPEGQQSPPVDDDGNAANSNTVLGVVSTTNLTSQPAIVPVDVVGPSNSGNAVPSLGLSALDICAGGVNDGNSCQANGDCPGGTCGGVVVFGSFEGVRGLAGEDLNGDGDTGDVVIGVYYA